MSATTLIREQIDLCRRAWVAQGAEGAISLTDADWTYIRQSAAVAGLTQDATAGSALLWSDRVVDVATTSSGLMGAPDHEGSLSLSGAITVTPVGHQCRVTDDDGSALISEDEAARLMRDPRVVVIHEVE